MKTTIAIVTLALLAGCSQGEQTDATQDTAAAPDTAIAEPAAPLAADGQPTPGIYKITDSEGKVFSEEVKPDGTYVQTDAEGTLVETGKWNQKSPGEYCYTADKEGATEQCNAEAVGADGVWTSTSPDGKTATVERVTA